MPTPMMSDEQLQQLLTQQPEWKLESGKLIRDWTFKDFVAAMHFVNAIAAMAEATGHHPDIDIRYNHVRLGLISHDAGGVTERDAAMAKSISQEFAAG